MNLNERAHSTFFFFISKRAHSTLLYSLELSLLEKNDHGLN